MTYNLTAYTFCYIHRVDLTDGTQWNKINSGYLSKYTCEDHRNHTRRKHRTRTAGCLFEASIQPASELGV